ncbi:MAG: ribosomal-protein-alanine N-acetyltransferase [Rhizobiales bacterium]|nr:ribosomal-protein-alanine N-acetyltransferase [Hyphomicrobiales bacterium]
MMDLVSRLFSRGQPVLSDAGPADAEAIAALHAASFRRGWSDSEMEQLLVDPNVVADRALLGRDLVGFILTRRAADEAEILSIAVDKGARGRGLGRKLLRRNLQRLAGLDVRAVFLEVGAENAPALALYDRMGFEEVGKRERYYGHDLTLDSTALVLRRELG